MFHQARVRPRTVKALELGPLGTLLSTDSILASSHGRNDWKLNAIGRFGP
jgi:hypothetical protein